MLIPRLLFFSKANSTGQAGLSAFTKAANTLLHNNLLRHKLTSRFRRFEKSGGSGLAVFVTFWFQIDEFFFMFIHSSIVKMFFMSSFLIYISMFVYKSKLRVWASVDGARLFSSCTASKLLLPYPTVTQMQKFANESRNHSFYTCLSSQNAMC